MIVRYSFEWLDHVYLTKGSTSIYKELLGSLSSSDFACFTLRNTCTFPHIIQISLVKHFLACFENSSVSHASNDLSATPQGVYPAHLKGGAFTVWPGRFRRFYIRGGVYSGFFLSSLKIAPEGVYTIYSIITAFAYSMYTHSAVLTVQ